MARFYGHFAAAYGTLWFVVVAAAFVSRSHINTGEFGLFGFPILALLYAVCRIGFANDQTAEIKKLRDRVLQLEWQLTTLQKFDSAPVPYDRQPPESDAIQQKKDWES